MSDYPAEIVACLGGDPTPEQWAAISAPPGPAVIVAGAGSGKTAVMAARVVHLALSVDPPIAPGNVLCLTFTNKATDNLVRRIRRALATIGDRTRPDGTRYVAEGDEPLVTNYNRFGQSIVARHGMLVGIEPRQRILTASQRSDLCAKVLDRMTFQYLHTDYQPTIVNDILSLAEQAANHRVTPEQIVSANEDRLAELLAAPRRASTLIAVTRERIELARAVREFLELKREYGVIDFGDQIEYALRVVEENPDVVREYRERFHAVLLDEYQDTNVAQARLLQTLFGGGHPVTAVGDPDQNIYAWRGASLHNLLRFPHDFPLEDGTPSPKMPLYRNFRSGSLILEAADSVIAELPAAQRPDPDKRLEPWAARGEGAVSLLGFGDEFEEAEAIADAIVAERTDGTPWNEIAVICRRHRLFLPLRIAFDARGIPAEFTGLAGLLQLPEIVELLSYARVAADSAASVPLARILLGPRFRVGIADLAAVAAWVKEGSKAMRYEGGGVGDAVPLLVAEALDRLDDLPDLSPEGRQRLESFRKELVDLRALARGPVQAFFSEVIRRTGLLAEIEASAGAVAAAAARRNISAFLDQVGGITPLEGDLTLPALLAHLDADDEDRDDWTQPVTEVDAVRVMTIHSVKGLEFDVVFVPGLSQGILPNTRVQQNPAARAHSLDFHLRGDRDILPAWDGVATHFQRDLAENETNDERRTAYVALTRARRRLWVSGANWYDGNLNAKNVGVFLQKLWDWGEGKDGIEVSRIEKAGDDDENPLEGARLRDVPPWPGPARPDDSDDLFPEGWRRAAADAAGSGVQASLLDRLTPEERQRFEVAASERRILASHLVERERSTDGGPQLPSSISVNGVVEQARCPKRFFWTFVRPLPRSSGPAARIGTDVHRWIERHSRGQGSLLEDEVSPDFTDEELSGQPGKVERLRQSFLESRFAGVVPLYVERSFLLAFGRFTVSGRIDAIFGVPDGAWEIVDWKTGKKPAADDPLTRMQLDLYALACMDVWRKRREDLRMTYLYLASGDEVTYEPENPEAIRTRVGERLAEVEERRFDATPGKHCRWCDFRPFCETGTAYLASESEA